MKKIQLTDIHKEKLFQIPLFRDLPLNIKESLLEKLDFIVYAADKKEIWDFQEKTKDGTVTEFTAQFSVKRTGGGVNGVIEFEVTMAVQSEIKQTDPA